MSLDPVLRDRLNAQVTTERYNSAFYRACANRLAFLNLTGLARWMRHAARDENRHASWFADYLIDRNEFPPTDALPAVTLPNSATMLTAGSVLFAEALKREQATTQAINALYELGDEVNDPQTCVFLHWFIEEQTRSEREITELLAELKIADNDAAAVIALDRKVGKHV